MFSSMWVGEEGQCCGKPMPVPPPEEKTEPVETVEEEAKAAPPGQVTTLACGEEGNSCGLPHPFSLMKKDKPENK